MTKAKDRFEEKAMSNTATLQSVAIFDNGRATLKSLSRQTAAIDSVHSIKRLHASELSVDKQDFKSHDPKNSDECAITIAYSRTATEQQIEM